MSAPSQETREEWRRDAKVDNRPYGSWEDSTHARILALLDALDAAEEREAEALAALETGDACGHVGCRALRERDEALERLAAVRALADEWDADAERACHGADHGGGCGDCAGMVYAAELREAIS